VKHNLQEFSTEGTVDELFIMIYLRFQFENKLVFRQANLRETMKVLKTLVAAPCLT
jgi:hypothetical protein